MILKRLHVFTLKSYIGPLFVTFFISLFVLLLQFLWKYIDDLVGKGLSWAVIGELMLYASAGLVPMALPLAILLASIMTFGNMGEHYELTALKSAGISLQRIMAPLIVLGVIISFGAFIFANNVIPYTNLKMHTLLHSVRDQRPELSIKPGIFNNDIDGYSIRILSKNKTSGMMYDFMIYDHLNGKGNNTVIKADSGLMQISDDSKYMFVTLYNGVRYEEMEEQTKAIRDFPVRSDRFEQQRLIFQLIGFDFTKADEGLFKNNYQVKNIKMLKQSIDSLQILYVERTKTFTNVLLSNNYLRFQNKVRNSDTLAFKRDSTLKHRNPEQLKTVDNIDSIYTALNQVEKIRILYEAKEYAYDVQSTIQRNNEDISVRHKTIAKHWIAWHQKFTLSFACFIFFFIGAPLGAIIRKGGFGLPIVVSILFFIIYYIISMMGLKMAREGVTEPYIGMWISSALLLPLGVFLTYKATSDSALFNTDAYFMAIEKFAKRFNINLDVRLSQRIANLMQRIFRIRGAEVAKWTLLAPALLFTLLAIVFAILPLRRFTFILAPLALVFTTLAYLQARKRNLRKLPVYIVSAIAVVSMLISTVFLVFVNEKVVKDDAFNQKLEQIQTETEQDLNETLEDLDINEIMDSTELNSIVNELDSAEVE